MFKLLKNILSGTANEGSQSINKLAAYKADISDILEKHDFKQSTSVDDFLNPNGHRGQNRTLALLVPAQRSFRNVFKSVHCVHPLSLSRPHLCQHPRQFTTIIGRRNHICQIFQRCNRMRRAKAIYIWKHCSNSTSPWRKSIPAQQRV